MTLRPAVAAALAVGLAGPAAAVTFHEDSRVEKDATVAVADAPGGRTITFSWPDAPMWAYLNFTTDSPFRLSFEAFEDRRSPGSDKPTALILHALDGPDDGASAPPAVQREYSTDGLRFDSPSPAYDAGALNPSDFTRIYEHPLDDFPFTQAPAPGVALFETLAAGSYRIGVFDSAEPERAEAVFAVTFVPAPPAILAVIGAFGLAFAVRRGGRAA